MLVKSVLRDVIDVTDLLLESQKNRYAGYAFCQTYNTNPEVRAIKFGEFIYPNQMDIVTKKNYDGFLHFKTDIIHDFTCKKPRSISVYLV